MFASQSRHGRVLFGKSKATVIISKVTKAGQSFDNLTIMSNLPPANSPEASQLGPNELSAYRVCLTFQHQATAKALIHARILGYLILHAPTENARHEVVKTIHSCNNDFFLLSKLGQSFIDYYIRPCTFSFGVAKYLGDNSDSVKKFKGRTPIPSDHPSRPSFDKDKKYLQETIREAPKSHVEAKDQVSRSCFICIGTNLLDSMFECRLWKEMGFDA